MGMISGYIQNGSMNEAPCLFHAMSLDVVVYTVMISGHVRNMTNNSALESLQRLLQREITQLGCPLD